jgi:predicted GIY-YIG superfamily endonuclease
MYCYFLMDDSLRKSYIGYTINLDRRLRQHNGELVGGAKYTRGLGWNRMCHIRNFIDTQATLQFEWYWKRVAKKMTGSIIEKKIKALIKIDQLGKTTKTSKPFSIYPKKLELIIEDPLIEIYIDLNEIKFNHFTIVQI